MPRNLELKVPYSSLSNAEHIARSIGAKYSATLHQRDTYYCIGSGRLKLREINGTCAELILYQRPTTRGKKISEYLILTVDDLKASKRILARTVGEQVVVQKERRLWLMDNARIHLDRVKGLGTFIEFEVVVINGVKQAGILYQRLCSAFHIHPEESLPYSYSDLLLKKRQQASTALKKVLHTRKVFDIL